MDKAQKMDRYHRPDANGSRTCRHPRYGDSDRCAVMSCPNYYMKGGGFWAHDFAERLDDQLASPCYCGSGLSSLLCDCSATLGPSTYWGVMVPEELRPNWNDNRVEVSWWKAGVRSALGETEES